MTNAELVAYLMSATIKLSGFPAIPQEEYPILKTLSQEQINQIQCPEDPHECRDMVAFYDHTKNTIFINNKLNLEEILDSSFLIHEMVHVLQYKHLGADIYKDCENTVLTERAAYRVQNSYLIRNGLFDRFGDSLAYMTCSPNQDVKSGHVKIEPVLIK